MYLLLVYYITLCICWKTCIAKNLCSKGPPVKKNPSECCDTPAVIDPPIILKCFQKWGEQTKHQSKIGEIPRGCCVAECAMNATKLLSNGKINREKARKHFLEPVKSKPQWQPIVSATVDECFQRVDENMVEIETASK